MNKFIILMAVFLITGCSDSGSGHTAETASLPQEMFIPHEGVPAGVPEEYNWKYHPRVNYGITVPEGWTALTGWGQVYAEETLPSPVERYPDIRVHIKDLEVYLYRPGGRWDRVQYAESPGGAWYLEDFAGDEQFPGDIRREAEGGISVQAGSGFNFHFYPDDRVEITPGDIAGVLVVCKARLTGDGAPKYLLNVGADYWRDLQAGWEETWDNNGDVGIGRFKYVTPQWQYFIMHTFSPEEALSISFPLN